MLRLTMLVAVAVCLVGARLGVQATGRQLLAPTNTSGIYYGEQAPGAYIISVAHVAHF
jgi:hypothetical protein